MSQKKSGRVSGNKLFFVRLGSGFAGLRELSGLTFQVGYQSVQRLVDLLEMVVFLEGADHVPSIPYIIVHRVFHRIVHKPNAKSDQLALPLGFVLRFLDLATRPPNTPNVLNEF